MDARSSSALFVTYGPGRIVPNLSDMSVLASGALMASTSAEGPGDDVIYGDSGDNVLDGGPGADSMYGYMGNDTYYVDNVGDRVYETYGYDGVYSSVSFSLSGQTIEWLTLTGVDDINATGNSLANTLTGNDGDNVLNGLGGADVMAGGLGDDTYYVDNVGDQVIELADGGVDQVFSSVSFNLTGQAIERLTLTGTGNIDATGNELDNILTGNSGDNELDGGAGADDMYGGSGDDTYYVDNAGDRVFETYGYDTVIATISFSLSGQTIEKLVLAGAAAINATGNSLNNNLVGNDASNVLAGLGGDDVLDGGAGADDMNGGAGNDIYYVDNAGDRVFEAINGGHELVYSSVSFSLAGQHIEDLSLTGTAAIDATGNSLDNFLYGNDADNVLNGLGGADRMYGGGGNDTYYVDNAGDVVTDFFQSGVDIIISSVTYWLDGSAQNVENITLTGSANISAYGNSLDNVIRGNFGNNHLSGGAGADLMYGGAGNDTYYVDNVGDRVYETYGYDGVYSSVSFSLSVQTIEWLTLTGVDDINATGNSLANTLTGNDGSNVLNGLAGADEMYGGKGNDTYYVDNANDQVFENAGEGLYDTVNSSVSYTLAAGQEIERLYLTGTADINATGNELNNRLFGNAGANILTGGDGNDSLVGGAGADQMYGGTGDDSYYVDDVNDQVFEDADEGYDTVYSSVSFTLAAGQAIEFLYLTDTADINATGNELNNELYGNAGANILSGGDGHDLLNGGAGADQMYGGDGHDLLSGGAGADQMYGGAGDDLLNGGAGADQMHGGTGHDIYYVDDVNDQVFENADEGYDTVYSSVSFTSAAGQKIEALFLTGTADINATGNELNNRLDGNVGANILTGGAGDDYLDGGAGADQMYGGTSDDIYVVDDVNDQVFENAGEGNDTVYSSISFSLAGHEIERLYLIGTASINATGNELNNQLVGNDEANILDGREGADTLFGGVGNDIYVFTAAVTAANADMISYFMSGADQIHLDNAVMASLGATGGLNALMFVSGVGAVALDGDDHIIYDTGSGQLLYDADGNGAGAAVLIATLTGAPSLAASDIFVI